MKARFSHLRLSPRTLGQMTVAAAALLALGACATQQPTAALGPTGTDIVNHPERHVGEQVTVHGKVNQAYSRGSFTVGPDGFAQSDLRILAAGPNRSVPRLQPGDRVEIHGVVRTFTQRDFTAGYATGFYGVGPGFYGLGGPYPMEGGFYGLGVGGVYPTYYTTWEQQPIVIADRVVKLTPGR